MYSKQLKKPIIQRKGALPSRSDAETRLRLIYSGRIKPAPVLSH